MIDNPAIRDQEIIDELNNREDPKEAQDETDQDIYSRSYQDESPLKEEDQE